MSQADSLGWVLLWLTNISHQCTNLLTHLNRSYGLSLVWQYYQSKFVSYKARMSGESDSRKNSHSTKFEWRPRKFKKLSFRELYNSKLSSLHPFDNMATDHWVKNRSKTERSVVSSRDTNPWSNFCDLHWDLICRNKWHLVTFEISTPLEIAVETHFYGLHGTKTTQIFFPADGEASWFLFSNSASLLSDGTARPENTYIFKVTGQAWEG